MPPGGAGTYYFSTYLRVDKGEKAEFRIMANGDMVCKAIGEHRYDGAGDTALAACSGLAQLQDGEYRSC